jgi:hypothetical protein
VQISGPVVQDAGDGNIGQTGVTRSDSLRRFEITAKDGFSDRISEGWNMQKSAIEEIRELKAQIESKTEQVKTEALDKASEAVSFLRDLGLDNDAILKELGFRGPAPAKETREGTPPKDESCQICHFRTDPAHDGRAHRGQTKKKPFTTEELEEKGLTKV